MRGRVMSLYSVIFLGSTPIGGAFAGVVGEAWGAGPGCCSGRRPRRGRGCGCWAGAVAVALDRARLRGGCAGRRGPASGAGVSEIPTSSRHRVRLPVTLCPSVRRSTDDSSKSNAQNWFPPSQSPPVGVMVTST